jgi:hypothetical protein
MLWALMKLLPTLTLLAAFTFAACDSKQEQAREKALERRADNLEDAAKATEKNVDAQADAAKKAADAQADALKKEADRVREQK